MKTYTLLSVLAALLFAASLVSAQPPMAWEQTYGGPDYDYCYSVHQTADGNIYLKGETESYGAGERDLFLVKADSLGNQLWYHAYGGSQMEYSCWQSYQSQDSSIIMAGYTESFSIGYFDFYLVKTDLNGTELWSNSYGTVNNDQCFGVSQTSDAGYIMSGFTYGPNDNDAYLVKVDADGNPEWTQSYGYSESEVVYETRQTSDGGYITAGFTRSLGVYDDGYLIKTDSSGNMEWDQHYAGYSWDYFFTVQETLDGGYIAVGYSDVYSGGPAQIWVVKTDSEGNQEWNKYYGGSAEERCFSFLLCSDGGYLLCGGTQGTASGLYDVWVIKIDAQGNVCWDGAYGGNDHELGWSIVQTAGGGYLIGGYKSPAAGDADMYLLRLEDPGVPAFTLDLIPHNPPIQIPAGGGSFQFDFGLDNIGTGWSIIDLWTQVTMPSGYTFPMLQKIGLFSQGGSTIYRPNLTQWVPGSVLPGVYTYSAYVKNSSTWEVLAQDSFDFEKLSGDGESSHEFGWTLFGWDDEMSPVGELQPYKFTFHEAYPNPFNPTATLSFTLPEATRANLSVYDVSGRMVANLVNGWRDAGPHQITFDGSDLTSGVYLYSFSAGEFHSSGKMVLMK